MSETSFVPELSEVLGIVLSVIVFPFLYPEFQGSHGTVGACPKPRLD